MLLSEQLYTYPSPHTTLKLDFLSVDCCWFKGGVGDHEQLLREWHRSKPFIEELVLSRSSFTSGTEKKWELGIFLGITLMIELKKKWKKMGTRSFSRYHTNDWTEKKNGKKWELGIFLGITLMIELWTVANICKHLCKHLQTSANISLKTFAELNLGFKIAFMKMRMKTMMMTERHFRESQRSSWASNDATFPCLNKP